MTNLDIPTKQLIRTAPNQYLPYILNGDKDGLTDKEIIYLDSYKRMFKNPVFQLLEVGESESYITITFETYL